MLPFPGGIEGFANGALILSAACAFLYFLARDHAPSWRRSVVKTATVATLAALAGSQGAPMIFVAALALSALGDLALAQEEERFFLPGLAAFAAAHIAYLLFFLGIGEGPGIFPEEPWRAVAAFAVAIAASAMLLRLPQALPRGLLGPVVAYVAIIAAMAITAVATPGWMVAAGALLFVASDAALAMERFLLARGRPAGDAANAAVWPLYVAAQMLTVLGVTL